MKFMLLWLQYFLIAILGASTFLLGTYVFTIMLETYPEWIIPATFLVIVLILTAIQAWVYFE